MQHMIALNSPSSFFNLSGAGIAGLCHHHVQLGYVPFYVLTGHWCVLSEAFDTGTY